MKTNHRMWALAVLAILSLVACSQSTPQGGTPGDAAAPNLQKTAGDVSTPLAGRDTNNDRSSEEGTNLAPDPLTVQAQLDTNNFEAQVVNPEDGGELSLTTAGGVQVNLSLPQSALNHTQTITMTALTGVDGLPLSEGLLAGVQFAPDGLRLDKAATLSIALPPGTSINQVIGFTYQGLGENYHLYPLQVDGSIATFKIFHFSGYGAGQGDQQDRENQSEHPPSGAEQAAEQSIAETLADLTEGQMNDPDSTLTGEELDRIYQILKQWLNDSVLPQLKQAESNERILEQAVREFFTWQAYVINFLGEDFFPDQVELAKDSMAKGVANTIEQAHQRCISENDPSEYQHMLEWEGFALLADIDQRQPTLDQESVFERVRKCTRFKLDFESTIGGTSDLGFASGTQEASVRAEDVPVPLLLDMLMGNGDPESPGEGKLQYLEYIADGQIVFMDGSTCTTNSIETVDGVMHAIGSIQFPPPKSEPWRPKAPWKSADAAQEGTQPKEFAAGEKNQIGSGVTLWIEPSGTKEIFDATCESFGQMTFDDTWWEGSFDFGHLAETTESGPLKYKIELERNEAGGKLYASKTEHDCYHTSGEWTIDSCFTHTYNLIHTPLP